MPNSGHNELIPPSGSRTPCHKKYPHAVTMIALVVTMDGYQLVRPSGFPNNSRRTVDREIRPRLKDAGGNRSHDRNHGFAQHRSVSDHADLSLAPNQLGSCAARNQRMKSADRSASNRDERKRENLPSKNRPRAINKPSERRHVQRGMHQ